MIQRTSLNISNSNSNSTLHSRDWALICCLDTRTWRVSLGLVCNLSRANWYLPQQNWCNLSSITRAYLSMLPRWIKCTNLCFWPCYWSVFDRLKIPPFVSLGGGIECARTVGKNYLIVRICKTTFKSHKKVITIKSLRGSCLLFLIMLS